MSGWSPVSVGVKYDGDEDCVGLEKVTDDIFTNYGACGVGYRIVDFTISSHELLFLLNISTLADSRYP